MWRVGRTSGRRFQRGCLWAIVLALLPVAASGQDLALSLQPSVAVAGGRSRGSQLPSLTSLKALLGLAPFLDLSFGVGFIGLPDLSESSSAMSGMASTVGAGLRLKRPHDRRSASGVSPWVDLEVLSVNGGAGDRRAFAVGGGVALPLGGSRGIWMGPFVRYLQLVEESGAGGNPRASSGLFAGLTFEIAFAPRSSGRATW